jgi:hypothetical protein
MSKYSLMCCSNSFQWNFSNFMDDKCRDCKFVAFICNMSILTFKMFLWYRGFHKEIGFAQNVDHQKRFVLLKGPDVCFHKNQMKMMSRRRRHRKQKSKYMFHFGIILGRFVTSSGRSISRYSSLAD